MKSEIRKQNKSIRNSMTPCEVIEKSSLAQNRFLESSIYKNSKVIMLYMPLGNETDTALIMDRAFRDGKEVVLPVCDTDNIDIIPCCVWQNTIFKKGSYSISEPSEITIADETKIDVVLVPGIAFDKKGSRIGFGKGYYDKFLKKTKAVKVGFCYGFQLIDSIDTEEYDICVDFVVTENCIYHNK